MIAKGPDIGRQNAFTDGVLVVSMTLLILNIEIPESATKLDGAALLGALAELWPRFLGYIVSFLVIGKYWLGYTDRFGGMERTDEGFAWRNILFLLCIGFVPFATRLLSLNGGWMSTAIYALSMIMVALALIMLWGYATRKGLIEIAAAERWPAIAPWLQIILVFGLSILIAPLSPDGAKLFWLALALPIYRWMEPFLRRLA